MVTDHMGVGADRRQLVSEVRSERCYEKVGDGTRQRLENSHLGEELEVGTNAVTVNQEKKAEPVSGSLKFEETGMSL